MTNYSYIKGFLVITIVACLFYYVESKAKQFSPRKIVGHTFRYSASAFFIFFILNAISLYYFIDELESIRWLFGGIFLFLLCLILCMASEKIKIVNSEVHFTKFFRTQVLHLDNIRSIEFQDLHYRYLVTDKTGKCYNISQYISGARVLVQFLKDKCKLTA